MMTDSLDDAQQAQDHLEKSVSDLRQELLDHGALPESLAWFDTFDARLAEDRRILTHLTRLERNWWYRMYYKLRLMLGFPSVQYKDDI